VSTQTINISLPKDLVKKIDEAAKAEFASRSDFIRQALVGKLRAVESRDRASDWLLLEALSEEVANNAERLGNVSDDDLVRAVKKVRQTKQSK
jgi:metal-responsive CopG/Arc/MetJ family transcriptional regulator